jgi:SAM-dependent methyltransferase
MPRNTARPTHVSQYLGRRNSNCIDDAHELSTLPPVPHSISLVYSFLHRLRSLRHRFWYGVSERLRWSRGTFHETPVRELPVLALVPSKRIAALRNRYQVQFEHLMSSATSLNNYEYLDILDRAWSHADLPPPSGGVICDIGCASFWYAAALAAFFKPRELVGVEVEGYRLFKNGHTRIDYAKGYVSQIPNARFVVADYVSLESPADVITAWFPFLTPAAILAWRLPLSLLAPERLFQQIYHNLNPSGLLVMVNHGEREAARAGELCVAAGLRCRMRLDEPGVLSAQRPSPAILTCWSRS